VQQPSNRAVTGSRLFDIESGIIATWARNVRNVDRTESLPYLPELVGQVGPRLVLGKGSGIDNVAEGLERIGITATEPRDSNGGISSGVVCALANPVPNCAGRRATAHGTLFGNTLSLSDVRNRL
jgi:hypothetical protein